MKRHQFDLVALLLLQSSTLLHKSCWFVSIRELGTGFVCYVLGIKDIETLFFISSAIQLSLPFCTRHAFPLIFYLLKRIFAEPFLFTLVFFTCLSWTLAFWNGLTFLLIHCFYSSHLWWFTVHLWFSDTSVLHFCSLGNSLFSQPEPMKKILVLYTVACFVSGLSINSP